MSTAHQQSVRAQFYALLERVPDSAADWGRRQEQFARWRADSEFQDYWPTLDHLLAATFDAERGRRWQAAAQAAQELREQGTYDFDAHHKQRQYDLAHARDQLS